MNGKDLYEKRMTAYGLNNSALLEVSNYLFNQFDGMSSLKDSKDYLDLLICELEKIQEKWNSLGKINGEAR